MKKTLLNSKTLFSLGLGVLCFNLGYSQQVIGSFPDMDGGFEAQTATTNMPSAGSSQTNTAQTTWTISSQSGTVTRSIINDVANSRSGNSFSAFSVNPGTTSVRLQSPTPVINPLAISTNYVVQYFYKSASDPGSGTNGLNAGIYLNNTSSGKTNASVNDTFAANTWTKSYATVTSNTTLNASNWAVVLLKTTASGGFNIDINFDDFVVYTGSSLDTVAPDAATGGAADAGANVSWTAPAAGVDGGGYVVVKFATAAAASGNNPNQNGIYQVGNTVGTGGTVVYIGTGTSFTDPAGVVTGNDYQVYTVDKAFNYSAALPIIYTILAVSDTKANSGVTISPNPASGYFRIDGNTSPISSVAVYTMEGKLVKNIANPKSKQVDISSLAKGVYLVKVVSNNVESTKKLIVK